MHTITVRGIDEALAARIKQEAANKGLSINQVVVETLRREFGLEKKKRFSARHSDLDHLFGRWSAEEFERIQGAIDQARCIDEELWK